jgi:hypothetical protein
MLVHVKCIKKCERVFQNPRLIIYPRLLDTQHLTQHLLTGLPEQLNGSGSFTVSNSDGMHA